MEIAYHNAFLIFNNELYDVGITLFIVFFIL